MLKAYNEVETYTLEPKLKVSPEATLIAPSLGRPFDAKGKTVYDAIVNALSLVIVRCLPSEPPVREVRVVDRFDPRFPDSAFPEKIYKY